MNPPEIAAEDNPDLGHEAPVIAIGSNTASPAKKLWNDGLWRNNAGLVQLLGLCPLLAVSTTLINAAVLGLATLATLITSNLLVSLLRHRLQAENRIILYVLVIASSVTVVDLAIQATLPSIHNVLGLFIPLIVTNCMIIARAEVFASRNNVTHALIDAMATGCGFLFLLCVMGAFRQWAGANGLLLALLPPGAFFTLGLLVVCKNMVDIKNVSDVKPNS